jgi:hypothetical protein
MGHEAEAWIACSKGEIPYTAVKVVSMNQSLELTLSEELYNRIRQVAAVVGQTPEEWVVALIQQRVSPPDARLRRHFGAVGLGQPTGADTEAIDQDLAQTYGDMQE